METSNKELDGISKQLRELQPQGKTIQSKLEALATKVAAAEARKTRTERDIFAIFETKVKIADIQEYEEKRERLQSDAAAKEAEYKRLISTLETQLVPPRPIRCWNLGTSSTHSNQAAPSIPGSPHASIACGTPGTLRYPYYPSTHRNPSIPRPS